MPTRMQQLPTLLGKQCCHLESIVGRIQPLRLRKLHGDHSFLPRRFVFRKVEERLVMSRKVSWEGYRRQDGRQAKFRRSLLSPSRLPLRAHFHRERDVWVRGKGDPFSSPEPLGLICNRPRDQETTGSGDENGGDHVKCACAAPTMLEEL